MEPPFIVFGAPQIAREEIDDVVAVLESGWLGTGPRVAEFERNFAAYKGTTTAYAAAVNSCSAALHVSMIAAGVGPGDEVITTPLTFCATVNAIIHAGATPVLADIDPVSLNIDPARIRERITPRTRAIVPVHFAGRPCDMDVIGLVARAQDSKVIEDCAHAIETEYHGRMAGTMGDFGCFSFYVTKNVVTGEGGMVLARNEADIARVKMLALHGMSKDAWHRFSDAGYKHYQVVDCGFKYNMTDLQAAIGIRQLARVEKNWLRRRQIWYRYQNAFADLPVGIPEDPDPKTRHAYHLYTLLIDEKRAGVSRDSFLDRMTDQRVGVGVHYLSIPEHPYYRHRFGWRPEDYPNAMAVGRQIASLPLSAKLTDAEVERIIETVGHSLENRLW
jgi:dTDP-4-amino-4,6-dideoxygalactose transaminase